MTWKMAYEPRGRVPAPYSVTRLRSIKPERLSVKEKVMRIVRSRGGDGRGP